MENHKARCLLCGGELTYFEQPQKLECAVCHQIFEDRAACVNGHYICDECHSNEGISLIVETCRHTDSRNPIELMQRLMTQPSIHMHGPEHHVLVGAALLAACRNSGGGLELDAALEEMRSRGAQVPGGVCGFWGCCGAAVSAGIYVSILTGSTPLKAEEWKLSNLMTARALQAIAELGGPRCCKRDSFTAVREAVLFTREQFGIFMELPESIRCGFFPLNAQCLGPRCPYNPAYTEKKP